MDKKSDTKKKLPMSQYPDKFKCRSILGHNVLLFRYIIAYDCKNILPKLYKETHFMELFSKDGKIIQK